VSGVIPMADVEDLLVQRIREEIPGLRIEPFISLDPNDYQVLANEAIALVVWGGEDLDDLQGRAFPRSLEFGIIIGTRTYRAPKEGAHHGALELRERIRDAFLWWKMESPKGLPIRWRPGRSGFMTRSRSGILFYSQTIRGWDLLSL
jgi:hypothetical protein